MIFILGVLLTIILINWIYNISHKKPVSIWSIKVFTTNKHITNPIKENLSSPSIQASDVTDVSAQFVADPFILFHELKYYLFFEVLHKFSGKGLIGLATSVDGENWEYKQIVLKENFHLSYPFVFKYKNVFYMIPETSKANKVLLYKAKKFPYEWEVERELINGNYVDTSVFQFENKWWMFTGGQGQLHIFFSDDLKGEWQEHPESPLIKNNFNITRPAGRVIMDNNQLIRYSQDCEPYYGKSVRAFKINTLTTSNYQEEELGIVCSGSQKENDWRKDGMHSIDQLQLGDDHWMIAVDGHRFEKKNYFAWKFQNQVAKIYNRFVQLLLMAICYQIAIIN